tara:strand:+ start:1097 stop:1747 length:651 start_codon:yes stop_codon:yes gene_type:complete
MRRVRFITPDRERELLQRAVLQVPAGGSIRKYIARLGKDGGRLILEPGLFTINDQISITADRVEVIAYGAKIQSTANNGARVGFSVTGSYFRWFGGEIDEPHGETGAFILGGDGSRISDVRFLDCYTAIAISGADQCVISGCHVVAARDTRYAMFLQNAVACIVANNIIEPTPTQAIHAEDTVTNTVFVGNAVDTYRYKGSVGNVAAANTGTPTVA